MGISDDIKIKPKENEQNSTESDQGSLINDQYAESDQDQNDSEIEIPIDRSGATPPVYEDIFSDHEEPFEHLKKSVDTIENTDHQKQGISTTTTASQNTPNTLNKLKTKKWIIVTIVLLIIAAASYYFVTQSNLLNNLSSEDSNNSSKSDEDSGVQIISGQDYTRIGTDSQEDATEETTEENIQNTTGESPTPEEPTAEEITSTEKSTILIKVLNGNGISGSAATLQKILVDNGFVIDSVANATNFNYQSTTIYYNVGKLPQAELIKNTLSQYLVVMYENPQVAGKFDAIVVVGKK